MPVRNTLRFPLSHELAINDVQDALVKVLASVEGARVSTYPSQSIISYLVGVNHDTWSRAARRKKLSGALTVSHHSLDSGTIIISKISAVIGGAPAGTMLQFDWVRGYSKQRPLWESLVSHVERKVRGAVATELGDVRGPDADMMDLATK